jgi:UDP-galactopyranose mutase
MLGSDRYLIVGAGFSGAVIARELATHTDAQILVVDERPHIAGNCHTSRDEATRVMVHHYGPHIFNTDDQSVWEYVQRFGKFRPFTNRVKAHTNRGVFTLPINLLTINQFFGKTLSPVEARAFVARLGDASIIEPQNFEEQALKFVGRELYEAFFAGYTRKQWGCDPREISAGVLARLPIRFNYDDNYYNARFQGIPEEGYSAVIGNLLDHPQIEVQLSQRFTRDATGEFDHVFYSGPIDAYFDYSLGRLGYRTVTFERIETEDDYQGNAVINYPGMGVSYTRIHEHKHFTPWEKHSRTVAFREYSKLTGPQDVPYYPVRKEEDKRLLKRYIDLAQNERNISFLGRLGTYRYLDMDDVIKEALTFSEAFLRATAEEDPDGSLRFSYVPPEPDLAASSR